MLGGIWTWGARDTDPVIPATTDIGKLHRITSPPPTAPKQTFALTPASQSVPRLLAEVRYSYRATVADEVTLWYGEEVEVIEGGCERNWWRVRVLGRDREGLAPSNYLRVLPAPSPTAVDAAHNNNSSNDMPLDSTHRATTTRQLFGSNSTHAGLDRPAGCDGSNRVGADGGDDAAPCEDTHECSGVSLDLAAVLQAKVQSGRISALEAHHILSMAQSIASSCEVDADGSSGSTTVTATSPTHVEDTPQHRDVDNALSPPMSTTVSTSPSNDMHASPSSTMSMSPDNLASMHAVQTQPKATVTPTVLVDERCVAQRSLALRVEAQQRLVEEKQRLADLDEKLQALEAKANAVIKRSTRKEQRAQSKKEKKEKKDKKAKGSKKSKSALSTEPSTPAVDSGRPAPPSQSAREVMTGPVRLADLEYKTQCGRFKQTSPSEWVYASIRELTPPAEEEVIYEVIHPACDTTNIEDITLHKPAVAPSWSVSAKPKFTRVSRRSCNRAA
eukprot:m.118589 g.118589  ORF g.118589 m.118589 type:complete len:502 (+) comp10986_c0_seq2:180-1685(+)